MLVVTLDDSVVVVDASDDVIEVMEDKVCGIVDVTVDVVDVVDDVVASAGYVSVLLGANSSPQAKAELIPLTERVACTGDDTRFELAGSTH